MIQLTETDTSLCHCGLFSGVKWYFMQIGVSVESIFDDEQKVYYNGLCSAGLNENRQF